MFYKLVLKNLIFIILFTIFIACGGGGSSEKINYFNDSEKKILR